MRINKTLLTSILLFLAAVGTANAQQGRPGLTLTSSAFEDGSVIPTRYTQAAPGGKFVSPALSWTNVPANTVSFVLLLHDPDVAMQKKTDDVTHWMAFNIPGTAQGLPEGVPNDAQLPDGTIQIKNAHGDPGFVGPGAPAPGPYHHYTFELFALDTKLNLGPDATRTDILTAMNGHILAKGILVGRFHR